MWELRLVSRDPRRALVGFSRGGDVAVTVEGQEIRGTVVGGAPPSPGQPVLVTGEPGNWAISGVALEPFSAPLSPTSTPQVYDRKGCGKCWTLQEFGSDAYQRRFFAPGYFYVPGQEELYAGSRMVGGRLESVRIPQLGIHVLSWVVGSLEPCLALARPTGVWLEGRLAQPLPPGSSAALRVDALRVGGPQQRHDVPLQIEGTRFWARWRGIPHTEHPDTHEGQWVTYFWMITDIPYDAPTVAITELEVCLGSVAYARVASGE